jgi:hypothetical protein
MYINYINGLVAGYVLVTWAIVLNILASNKLGIAFAIISIAAAYILETIRTATNDSDVVHWANILLTPVMIVSTILSYVSWSIV